MARPFLVFITTLLILITMQLLLEDYFNIFDLILGPLDDSEDSKIFQVKPKFINTNVVSDEQVMDYVFQKSKQVKLAQLYVRRLINSLKQSSAPLPKSPLMPSLFEHLSILKYYDRSDSDSFDWLSNLLQLHLGRKVPANFNADD